MALTFRECTPNDLDTLIRISRETFAAAFEQANDPKDFNDYLKKAFHPDKMASELDDTHSFFYFVFEDEVLVGYFKLNLNDSQTDIKNPDAVEIERIYVLESHQGKQIGAWMIHQIIGLAKGMGKTFIWLGVWEENPKAIKFYQRHGFEKFDEHPYYIGSDKQTDWLLRLDLQ
ncbi:GNAT family N-acetyltransferase [Allomuricauda sp. M10]|uniref:GNAT family N-acetyltransferase n=1 Tax=Allomuricauda sp. M10 TaxID=2683292 RepID=UPI001D193544|nr:GNAT family N-acetyltransferase [Muricauda sp. M10]